MQAPDTPTPKPASRRRSLEKRLASYGVMSLAVAGAATVGAPPAQASVVYFNNGGSPSGPDDSLTFLTFEFPSGKIGYSHSFTAQGTNVAQFLLVSQVGSDYRDQFIFGGGISPAPLAVGAVIGPGASFGGGSRLANYNFETPQQDTPPWGSGYMGLVFQLNGQTHYGWAGISSGRQLYLSDFAYETTPNQPILAGSTHDQVPEPASVELMALGAAGLAIYCRKRKKS
jgi:hypothetical protein